MSQDSGPGAEEVMATLGKGFRLSRTAQVNAKMGVTLKGQGLCRISGEKAPNSGLL